MSNVFNRVFRRPFHLGTRNFTSGENSAKAVCVFPVLRGETVERVALELQSVAREEAANFDQPPIFCWAAGFVPWPFGTVGTGGVPLNTAALDARALDFWGSAPVLNTDPNSGAGFTYAGFDDFSTGSVVTFKRTAIGTPVPVAADVLANTDARHIDVVRTVIEKPLKVATSGLYIVACMSPTTPAETTFGVEVIDNTADLSQMHGALTNLTTAATPVGQLLWGGDSYVESSSVLETARRHYATCRPAIRLADPYQPNKT